MSQNPWQSLPNLEDKDAFFSAYLETLCQLIPQVAVAGLFWVSSEKKIQVLAKYPNLSTDLGFLVNISEQTLQDACGLVQNYEGPLDANHLVGFPVEVSGKVQLIIVMAVEANSEAALHNVMGQIEWSLGQIDRYFFDQKIQQMEQQSQTAIQASQILGQVLSQATFAEAVVSLVENLAKISNSERVSFGQFEGLKSRILAISNTLDFGQKLALVEAIQAAQLEAKMQMQTCVFPLENSHIPQIIRAHADLSVSQGHNAVLTLLIYEHQTHKVIFAVTFERNGKHKFNEVEAETLSHIVTLAGAVLLDKWHAEMSLLQRLGRSIQQQWVRLFGPGYTYRKIFVLATVCLVSIFYVLNGTYRLSTDAKLEASQQFLVTMPFDGYLLSSSVKAGDVVNQNQVIAKLDDREYQLNLLKAQGKRQQLLTEFSLAQSDADRSKMSVLQAQIQQIEADIHLAKLYLDRSAIKSPISGLIIEGDLTQRLGDAVKTGDHLFVIAKMNGYLIKLQIPESRVMDVKAGQQGKLILQSLPHDSFDFTVNRVTPMQQVAEGSQFYVAEANLEVDPNTLVNLALKPGMQGVAKIEIDQRNEFGIWARDTYEWLILTWWRWWGDWKD